MQAECRADQVRYRSERRGGVAFRARYGPVGEAFVPAKGSLEHFLTERYCLYHRMRRGAPYRLEIHHPPWTLQVAQAEIGINTMANGAGLSLKDAPALLHFAMRQDAIAWGPTLL